MRILTVVGNRPQFIKAAAVSGLLRQHHEEILVHTGQHYDDSLSRVFFTELGLASPERELGIGGGSNTQQSARMLAALEPLLKELRPDAVLVYGDTNSTLAGGLSAAQAGVPVVHVEAGMRSFDRAMPEELNRVLTDHLSALLLCSSQTAAENLRKESVSGAIEVVGDVMVDVALRWQPAARANAAVPSAHGVKPGEYLLLTAHRAGNVDDPQRLSALVELVRALPGTVLIPLHPRTRARLQDAGLLERLQAQRRRAPDRATRLRRVQRPCLPGARRADRLRRSAEGGLPRRRALRHAARQHRVGGDRADGLERACGPRHLRRACRARTPTAGRAPRALRGRARRRALRGGDRAAVSRPAAQHGTL